jgi:hypothetical protein
MLLSINQYCSDNNRQSILEDSWRSLLLRQLLNTSLLIYLFTYETKGIIRVKNTINLYKKKLKQEVSNIKYLYRILNIWSNIKIDIWYEIQAKK